MKNIFSISIFLTLAIFLGACTPRYAIQKQEDTIVKTSWTSFSEEELTKAVILSLKQRAWEINSVANPIRARYFSEKDSISAKIRIFIKKGELIFDLTGSMKDNEPFAPKEYITYLQASIKENLAMQLAVKK